VDAFVLPLRGAWVRVGVTSYSCRRDQYTGTDSDLLHVFQYFVLCCGLILNPFQAVLYEHL